MNVSVDIKKRERERGIICTINIIIEFYIEFVASAAKHLLFLPFPHHGTKSFLPIYGYQI